METSIVPGDYSEWSAADKLKMARSIYTDSSTLARLASELSRTIRLSVATNRNTSLDTLYLLARDSEWVVIRSLAGRTNIPIEIQTILASHPETVIRSVLAQNTTLSPATLIRLYNYEEQSSYSYKRPVRYIYLNKNTPAWLKAVILTKYGEWVVE